MRTDTRTLEERIADRDAKPVVATIERSHPVLVRNRRLLGPASPGVRHCGAPALRTV
jgi:hypothetical protein